MKWHLPRRGKRPAKVGGSQRAATRHRAARFEILEPRTVLTALPFGAMPDDTGEYLLGDVHVNVVFLESDGSRDNGVIQYPGHQPISYAPENWSDWLPGEIAALKTRIQTGVEWWSRTLDAKENVRDGLLNFTWDFARADTPINTGYEPIARHSDDFTGWIYDFLGPAGFANTLEFSPDIRAFNNFQRQQHNADWAFTIFVVNDRNDVDDTFANGGSFLQAFSYAGGRFMVVPASRPEATFAHEAGHMFWALDEYAGGGTYDTHRGYYDTQNTNAANNPNAGFQQQPSIMANNTVVLGVPTPLLNIAYNSLTTSQSSQEMVGWKDGDGDGIFDVLDVPFALAGTGRYDAGSQLYRFTGNSAVRTLPNQNPAGLKNDITINRIRQVEFAVDGGSWQVAQTFADRTYKTNLELSIPLAAGEHTIKIRTLDTRTGAMSPEFIGNTTVPTSAPSPGASGFVFFDSDGDGSWDATEGPLVDWAVELVDEFGTPIVLRRVVEPNPYVEGTVLNSVHVEVTLSAIGADIDKHIQRLGFVGAEAGTFTLSYGGLTTVPLAFNASADSVRAALENLVNVGLGNVAVVKLQDASAQEWQITLQGALAGANVGQVSINTAGLLPGVSSIVQTIDPNVIAVSSNFPSAGKVFGTFGSSDGLPVTTWSNSSRQFKAEFSIPVATVSLRAMSNGFVGNGRLEAYDSAGNLLERYTTSSLASGKQEVMTISRPEGDIAYVVAGAHLSGQVMLDTLTWGPGSSATTNTLGAWSLSHLVSGSYRVKVTPPAGHVVTTPSSGQYTVNYSAGSMGNLNFGIRQTDNIWHNLAYPEDVNNDPQHLVNALDLLTIINWLTVNGSVNNLPSLGDPNLTGYIDVNNDGGCNVLDLLAVINRITITPPAGLPPAGGEGETGATSAASGQGDGSGGGEGELWDTPAATAAEYFARNPQHFADIPGTDLPCCCAGCVAGLDETAELLTASSLPPASNSLPLGSSDSQAGGAAFSPRRIKLSRAVDDLAAEIAAHGNQRTPRRGISR